MDIDRRKLLAGSARLALTELVRPVSARGVSLDTAELSGAFQWHPFIRLLLDRARRAHGPADKTGIERIIREVDTVKTNTNPLVIKWLADPSCAFEYLSGLGLDRLLEMDGTSLWSRAGRQRPTDDRTLKSWRRVPHEVLADIFNVEEHDRALMAPKLIAKSPATTGNASAEAVFKVRAIAAQIGWLETCMPIAAAQAVANIELFLAAGVSEHNELVSHQLRVFETNELGLLATWEMPLFVCLGRLLSSHDKAGDGFINRPAMRDYGVLRVLLTVPDLDDRLNTCLLSMTPPRSNS
jgi:hypothetical protein